MGKLVPEMEGWGGVGQGSKETNVSFVLIVSQV